jgi:hypothetical protein
MRFVCAVILAVSVGFVFPAAGEEIYKWVDEEGKVHLTQNPAEVPEKYRDQIPELKGKKLRERPTPVPAVGYGTTDDFGEEPPAPAEETDESLRLEGVPEEELVPEEGTAEPLPAEQPAPKKEELPVAKVDPNAENAVTVVGGLSMAPGDGGGVVFTGKVRNNSEANLNSVVLKITIRGEDNNPLESNEVTIAGNKGAGFLDAFEEAGFTLPMATEFNAVSGYQYSLNWKFIQESK